MKNITLQSLILGLFFYTTVATSSEVRLYPGCGTMFIEILNDTKAECKLVNFDVIHGETSFEYGISSIQPSNKITSEETTVLYIDQFVYGPEVELTYNCNGKIISLNSQMNRPILWGNIPTATVKQNDAGLIITHRKWRGICIEDTRGSDNERQEAGGISWTISDKH